MLWSSHHVLHIMCAISWHAQVIHQVQRRVSTYSSSRRGKSLAKQWCVLSLESLKPSGNHTRQNIQQTRLHKRKLSLELIYRRYNIYIYWGRSYTKCKSTIIKSNRVRRSDKSCKSCDKKQKSMVQLNRPWQCGATTPTNLSTPTATIIQKLATSSTDKAINFTTQAKIMTWLNTEVQPI
jgi:hypothetical protein